MLRGRGIPQVQVPWVVRSYDEVRPHGPIGRKTPVGPAFASGPACRHENARTRGPLLAPNRRDRLRAMLADLEIPGAQDAVDGILSEADSGAISPAEAIEQLLNAQIVLHNNRRLQTVVTLRHSTLLHGKMIDLPTRSPQI